MPKRTLTPIHPTACWSTRAEWWFPTSLSVEERLRSSPRAGLLQQRGLCGTAVTPTLCLVFPSGHTQEFRRWNVEWQHQHGTPWFSLGKFENNNQVQVLAERVGMDTQIQTAEVIPDLREPLAQAKLTPVGILSFPGLGGGHRKNKQPMAPKPICLTSCCSSIHPTSFKACLKYMYRTRQKMSLSSLKWHKIAKTTRRERW